MLDKRIMDWFRGMRASLRAVFGTDEHMKRIKKSPELDAILDKMNEMGSSAEKLKSTLGERHVQLAVVPARTLEDALTQIVDRGPE